MITYTKKIAFFNVKLHWFVYKWKFIDIFNLNARFHIKTSHKNPSFAIKEITHTLELDLKQSTEVIFGNFSKQIRQQVKIAEEENTTCFFHEDVEKFVEFFNQFAIQKKTFTITSQEIYALNKHIKLSFAVNNNQILAAHSYLVDKETSIVRLLHSATKRLDVNADRNLIGRGNKYLTVTDIMYFKDNGYSIFDFGGYAKDTDDESLKGINKFKELFGGKLVECLDYYSCPYWLLKKTSKLLGTSGKF